MPTRAGFRAAADEGFHRRRRLTSKLPRGMSAVVVILHLLSQMYLTGSEVYVADLCGRQLAAGHRCIIASGMLTVTTQAEFVPVPLHITKGVAKRNNLDRLVELCEQESVDILHAHSRAACKYADALHRKFGIAYVTTIHGRQTPHLKNRYWNVFGDSKITVCEALKENMVAQLKHPPSTIRVIRNGI